MRCHHAKLKYFREEKNSMVQVTFDTNSDSLPELEEALKILQQALERRGGNAAPAPQKPQPKPKMDLPEQPQVEEETVLDTPFLKIVSKEDHHEQGTEPDKEARQEQPAVPTLNELLSESLSEDDLGKLFKEQVQLEEEEHKKHPAPERRKSENQDAYIEIIEYTEEK
jgi:hypothetical protein